VGTASVVSVGLGKIRGFRVSPQPKLRRLFVLFYMRQFDHSRTSGANQTSASRWTKAGWTGSSLSSVFGGACASPSRALRDASPKTNRMHLISDLLSKRCGFLA
jgi:hypothetical protein